MKKYLVVVGLLLVWSWGSILAQTVNTKSIVVASKNFPESRLLGEIMAQLIERETDIKVVRKLNLGFSTVVFTALQNGKIDLYPEYTGTAWEEYLKIPTKVHDSLKAYLVVSERMRNEMDIIWLPPFGFQNSFALAMIEDKAQQLNIRTISDLGRHQSNLTVGTSNDFYERQDGFKSLMNAYEFNFPRVKQMEHGLVYEALASSQIDVTDIWTTDGKLTRYRLRILEDDRHFFPPYHCAPIIRQEVLQRYPELRAVLGKLAYSLDEKKMQQLNAQLESLGQSGDPYEVLATRFLDELAQSPQTKTVNPASQNFVSFLNEIKGDLVYYTMEHLGMSFIAVVLAICFSVPLGIALTRYPRGADVIMGAAGIVQTIPSLALMAAMIPLLGLGYESAILALFLYAILPILRNTYTGIRLVDRPYIEAARGIGLTSWQILTRIELPLAIPTIMAGIRTASVISIGVATLAALVGAGGLGQPIVTGLQLNRINWIIAGTIPAAGLALVVDFLLARLE